MAAIHNGERSPLLDHPNSTIASTAIQGRGDGDAASVEQDLARSRKDERFKRYMTIWAWISLPTYIFLTFYVVLPIYAIAASMRYRGISTGGDKEFADEPRMYIPFILLISVLAWRVWVTIWWVWPSGPRMVRALLVAIYWVLAIYALFYTGCYNVYPRNCGFGRQRDHYYYHRPGDGD